MLHLKPYSEIKHLEDTGNFAVSKYYRFPYRIFYRKKFKMAVSFLDKGYKSILDFGSGPGILIPELKRRAVVVKGVDKLDIIDPRWKYDVIMCNSVLEFVDLNRVLYTLRCLTGGFLVVASPMDTWITRLYFKLIGDKNYRHSHLKIISEVSKKFNIVEYKTWLGVYFALKATPR